MKRIRAGVLGATLLAAAGCSSRPAPEPVVPRTEPALEPRTPSPPPPESEAPELMAQALAALAARNYDAAHVGLLEVIDLCGRTPLGEQALLLMATAELDPRNPDPRRNLAAEATALLLEGEEKATWVRSLTESLYAIALKLGGTRAGPNDAEASELKWRLRSVGREEGPRAGASHRAPGAAAVPLSALVDEDPLEWASLEAAAQSRDGRPSSSHSPDYRGTTSEPYRPADHLVASCHVAWPGEATTGSPSGRLPSLAGSSYPAQVAALARQVRELEEELERVRRIVTQQ